MRNAHVVLAASVFPAGAASASTFPGQVLASSRTSGPTVDHGRPGALEALQRDHADACHRRH